LETDERVEDGWFGFRLFAKSLVIGLVCFLGAGMYLFDIVTAL
jgi:hypothetical protein